MILWHFVGQTTNRLNKKMIDTLINNLNNCYLQLYRSMFSFEFCFFNINVNLNLMHILAPCYSKFRWKRRWRHLWKTWAKGKQNRWLNVERRIFWKSFISFKWIIVCHLLILSKEDFKPDEREKRTDVLQSSLLNCSYPTTFLLFGFQGSLELIL